MPTTDPAKINLLGSRVLVELIPPKGTYKSSIIIIPKESRKRSVTGTVLAIGPEQFNVSVGNVIAFSQYSGIPLRESGKGENIIILDDNEILLVAENEEEKEYKTVLLKFDVEYFEDKLGVEGFVEHVYFNQVAQTVYVKAIVHQTDL